MNEESHTITVSLPVHGNIGSFIHEDVFTCKPAIPNSEYRPYLC